MVIDIVLTDSGKSLYLDADTEIQWVQENMLLEQNVKLRGKYSYPFSIDRSANSSLLGFADVMQVNGAIQRFPCIVYVSGNEFYRGQLNIMDWTDQSFNVAITRDTKEIDTSKYLDELGLRTYSSIADAGARNTDKEKVFPEVDYCFPQFYNYNESVIEKYGTDANGSQFIIVNWRNGDTELADGKEVVVPMFYLMSVLREIFDLSGYSLKTSLFTDAFFSKLLIYNPITAIAANPNCLHLEAFTYNGGYGVVRMRDKLSCFTVPVGAVVYIDVYEFDNYGQTNYTQVQHTVSSPDIVSISTFMTAIKTTFLAAITNATFISEDYTADFPAFTVQLTTGDEMIIQSTGLAAPDYTKRLDRGIHPIVTSFNELRTYQSTVQMSKHLPHINVSAFLNSVKDAFNLAIVLDEVNVVVKIYKRTDISDPSKKVNMDNYLLDIIEGSANTPPNYKFVYNHDPENDTLTEDLQNIADNVEAEIEPITEISTGCGTLACENLRNSNSGFSIIPKVNQEIGDYSDSVNFGLRFLFLYGYVNDSNGQKIIKANNDGLLPNQLYHDYYQDWYDRVKKMYRAPVLYMNLGLDQLKSIEPYMWQVGKIDFIWSRITTTINNSNGIQPSKVEGFKL